MKKCTGLVFNKDSLLLLLMMIKKAVWFVSFGDSVWSGFRPSRIFPILERFGKFSWILENHFSVEFLFWRIYSDSGFFGLKLFLFDFAENSYTSSDRFPRSNFDLIWCNNKNWFYILSIKKLFYFEIFFSSFPAKPIRAGHHPGVANPAVS